MAEAAYEKYAESDGTSVIDFALDALLFTQSQYDSDKTLVAGWRNKLAESGRHTLDGFAATDSSSPRSCSF